MAIHFEDGCVFLEENSRPAGRLDAPLFRMDEEELEAAACGLSFEDRVCPADECILRVERTVTNESSKTLAGQLITAARSGFRPDKYTIPCVMYDGNEWGSRNSPRGLTRDGKPWIFAYDRTGIPSCTLTEDTETAFALFASDRDEKSLRTSCSLIDRGGYYEHRIFYPVVEEPLSYTGKNKMTEAYTEELTLAPGESFTAEFFLFAAKPEWKEYGCAALLDHVNAVFPYRLKPVLPPEKVWELGIAYLSRLIHDYNGRTLIIAGFDTVLSRLESGHMGAKITPEEIRRYEKLPEYNTYGFNREIYEIGWAGQGFLATRMLLTDAFERGDEDRIRLLTDSLHNWTAVQRENGMILPHYEHYAEYEKVMREGTDDKQEDPCLGFYPDVCNLGWGASEMSKIYTLFKEHGEEHPEFLRFAERICDFFAAHYSEKTGFGKLWSLDGEALDPSGTIGGFMISALIDTWRVLKKPEYLETAEKAMDYYYERDLDHFRCAAGAIDCQSIDKETSYPFVVAALDLYEITGKPLYLKRARQAAYYFFSWVFQYDALYPEDADFTKFGYHTAGGTAISAEHHAIDPWGALLSAEFIRLRNATGDRRWETRAKMMWNNSLYGITTDETVPVHGLTRPLGSQNEGFFQARWTKYRADAEERGHFNDWLVSWVSCWRLTTLDRMKRVLKEETDVFAE
ncbi:MAG: hypothetical protein IJM76_09480 [Lachnospiraceae bacterium]|nr:hypothetical protein [Lachnospiraceae bacterium]